MVQPVKSFSINEFMSCLETGVEPCPRDPRFRQTILEQINRVGENCAHGFRLPKETTFNWVKGFGCQSFNFNQTNGSFQHYSCSKQWQNSATKFDLQRREGDLWRFDVSGPCEGKPVESSSGLSQMLAIAGGVVLLCLIYKVSQAIKSSLSQNETPPPKLEIAEELIPYDPTDPSWPEDLKSAAQNLQALLGEHCLGVCRRGDTNELFLKVSEIRGSDIAGLEILDFKETSPNRFTKEFSNVVLRFLVNRG